jgi:hypothetical protein
VVSPDRSNRAATLEALARACQLGRVHSDVQAPGQPTGYAALDESLPQKGWPVGALTELLLNTSAHNRRVNEFSGYGIGELRLLMPALAQLTQADRYVAFIEPPHLIYPPALAQQGVRLERVLLIRPEPTEQLLLWTMEQTLRCAAFGAVLAWPRAPNDKELRRLQLAAETGRNLAFIYRPTVAALTASPAALRLALEPVNDGVQIEIKKSRGGRAGAKLLFAVNGEQ